MRRGWTATPLKNLCQNFKDDIVDGPFGANLKREHYTSSGVPVLKIQNVKPFGITLKKMDYVDDNKAKELKRHAYRKGDIIITKLGLPLGASAIVDDSIDDGIIVADLVRVRAEKIDSKYLCYHLNSPTTNALLNAQQGGSTRPRVKISAVRELPINVPPLPEQKRIVAILDEAFAGIDAAVANTEKNLANARELFESYLSAVIGRKGEGWIERPIDSLVHETCSLSYGIVQPGQDVSEGLPVVRPMDLTEKVIKRHKLKTIDPSLAKAYSRTTLQGDDLLLCVRGTTGVVSIADKELKGANVTRGIVPIRFDPAFVGQEFGYYLLTSPIVQEQIAEKTYGAALMQINIRDLRKIRIPIPPQEKQGELRESLDELSAEARRLGFIYRQKLNALAELKQSLLQKAFSGQLTASPEKEIETASA